MSKRTAPVVIAMALLALVPRALWLTADPPADRPVGIVWHDEGAWVHNARNRALWGIWRTDEWNPMYVAPVFTGLEYVAFSAFGVGTWQARTVPVVSGLSAVIGLWWGLSVLAGRHAALFGMALLGTNFFFIMWNRAALMESTLAAWLVLSWACYAQAQQRPAWGLAAGAAAVLAFFTKAAAAFFLAAIGLEAAVVLALGWSPLLCRLTGAKSPGHLATRAATLTLVGLAAAAAVAVLVFVLPNWREFQFYNWQMSVTRKPAYTLSAFMQRASWLPVAHDVFSRIWLVLLMGAIALVTIAARWWTTASAARLLALWVLLGLSELVFHDSGNDRRYVMLVPPLIGLAAWLTTARSSPDAAPARVVRRDWATIAVLPVVLLAGYLVWGGLVRLAFLGAIANGDLRWTVRLAAALAALTAVMFVLARRRGVAGFSRRWPGWLMVAAAGLVMAIDLGQYRAWALNRTDLNYKASVAVGQVLPPGTLVHGKLANGLSLENRIRPVFVGRGFGNYADRFDRPDIRYLLTYILPRLAYEGEVLEEVVRAYPDHRIIQIFPVSETPGQDIAALIEK